MSLTGHEAAVTCVSVTASGSSDGINSSSSSSNSSSSSGRNGVAGVAGGDVEVTVLSGSSNGSLVLWDVENHTESAVLRGHTKRVACCLVAQTAAWQAMTRRYNTATSSTNASNSDCQRGNTGNGGNDDDADDADDDDEWTTQQHLVLSGSKDKTLRSWDLSCGESRVLYTGGGGVTSMALLPCGTMLVVGTGDCKVLVLALPRQLWAAARPGHGAAAHATRQRAAAAGGGGSGGVGVEHELKGHRGSVRCVAASPVSPLALSCDEISLRLWHTGSGKCLQAVASQRDVTACCFAFDSEQWFAFSTLKQARVFRADRASEGYCEAMTLKGHAAQVKTAVALPDNKLATG